MVVYRITLARWAESLTGSGYPARWNPKGYHVVYSAGSRALACLENLVHRSGEGLNAGFKITTVHIPDAVSADEILLDELPPGWHTAEGYPVCQEIGRTWLEEERSCVVKVPSSIIHDEWNLLINPKHPDFENVSIKNVRDFSFDQRLQ
jgi:RES domain-containing protein